MGDIWSIKEQYKRQMGNLWGSRGDRGLNAGGHVPTASDQINYFNISSAGDSVDFGDLVFARHGVGLSSDVRGIFAGGFTSPAMHKEIDYVTMATTGNAADFGDLTDGARWGDAGAGTRTRGLWMGGDRTGSSVSDIIDYITIPSTGNAADFGNLTVGRRIGTTVNNHVRAVHAAGYSGSASNVIDYISIASTGNAVDFGDGTTQYNRAGASSTTRGVFAGGRNPIANTIDYIQFSTLGDDVDFGDLSTARGYLSGCSNDKRGVFVAGLVPSLSDIMDFVTIASAGNALDFGDCIVSATYTGACSQGHGGIEEGEPRGLPVGRGIGLFGGGMTPSITTVINELAIPTLGTSSDFGDMTSSLYSHMNSAASTTRCLACCGADSNGTADDTIEAVEFASRGNSSDFGNAGAAMGQTSALSSSTRGIMCGGIGRNPWETIEYVTIATIGNATDFGDLATETGISQGAVASGTRGVFSGGGVYPSASAYSDKIEYITIASTGDATDFGDLTSARLKIGSVESSIRGVFAGGRGPSDVNIMDYITIASTGDATDFGDTSAVRRNMGGASTQTRGVFAGGLEPAKVNTIDYITIASTGDAADFGDMVSIGYDWFSGSDTHGGLTS